MIFHFLWRLILFRVRSFWKLIWSGLFCKLFLIRYFWFLILFYIYVFCYLVVKIAYWVNSCRLMSRLSVKVFKRPEAWWLTLTEKTIRNTTETIRYSSIKNIPLYPLYPEGALSHISYILYQLLTPYFSVFLVLSTSLCKFLIIITIIRVKKPVVTQMKYVWEWHTVVVTNDIVSSLLTPTDHLMMSYRITPDEQLTRSLGNSK